MYDQEADMIQNQLNQVDKLIAVAWKEKESYYSVSIPQLILRYGSFNYLGSAFDRQPVYIKECVITKNPFWTSLLIYQSIYSTVDDPELRSLQHCIPAREAMYAL